MKNLVFFRMKNLVLLLVLCLFFAQAQGQYVYRAESNPGTLPFTPNPIGLTQLNNGKLLSLASRQANQEYVLYHLDSQGNVVKAVTRTGGVVDLDLEHMLATTDGGYVVSGTAYISGTAHTYLAKYDAADAYQWSMAVDHPQREHEFGTHVVETAQGFTVTGQVYKPSNFPDPEYYYVTIFQVTPAGLFNWARRFENTAQLEGLEIAETSDSGFAIACERFGSGSTFSGLKYYKTGLFGHLLWGTNYGSNLRTTSIATETGYVYLLGFEPFGSSMTLLKLTNGDAIAWGKKYTPANGRDLSSYRMEVVGDEIRIVGKLDQFSSVNEPVMMSLKTSDGSVNWAKEYNFATFPGSGMDFVLTNDGGMAFSTRAGSGASNPVRVIKTDANGYSGCLEDDLVLNVTNFTPAATPIPEAENSVTSGVSQTRTWNLAIGSTTVTCCDVGASCASPVAANSRFQHSMGTGHSEGAYSLHIYDSGVLIGGSHFNFGSGAREQLIMRSDVNGSLCRTYLVDQQHAEWALDVIQGEVNCGQFYAAGFDDTGGNDFNAILTNMDASGTAHWSAVLSEEGWGQAYEVIEIDGGDLLVCGFTTEVTNGGEDMLLARVQPDGTVIWSRAIGTEENDRAYAIADAGDGVVLVGETAFDDENNGGEIYVVKTDYNGTPQWSRIFGHLYKDLAHDVEIDRDGKIYMTGYMTDENGDRNVMLSRLSANGNIDYNSQFLLDENDEGFALALHPDKDELYIAGYSNYVFPTQDKQAYAIVARKSGGINNAIHFGSTGREAFQAVQRTATGDVIMVGNSNSFTPGGDMDVYMVKMDQSWNSGCYNAFVYPYGESIFPDYLQEVGSVNTEPWRGNPIEVLCPEDRLEVICQTPEDGGNGKGEERSKQALIEKEAAASFTVYPVPAHNQVSLQLEQAWETESEIRIVNLQGRTLREYRLPANTSNAQIDLKGLGAGVYFMTVSNAQQKLTQKITVQ